MGEFGFWNTNCNMQDSERLGAMMNQTPVGG
jgi:hypothetical protein